MTDKADDRYIPDGYTWQIAESHFRFNIVTDTRIFKQYSKFAESHNLLHNLCNQHITDTAQPHTLLPSQYIHVIQKSPLWLTLRNMADGTASSVGKYIMTTSQYPTHQQLLESWKDKIDHKPFHKTHTTAGHMQWGVGYEDPALIHFAIENMLAVTQVGTIKLPLTYILQGAPDAHVPPELYNNLTHLDGAHLLISPDGLVGKPSDPLNYIGMLEIKCISPFHHIANPDNTLSWVQDMESRQWHHPQEIPFVYMVQMGLQAISGLQSCNLQPHHTMWFIRWSPNGFSQFSIPLQPLIHFGTIAAILYFQLIQRYKTTAHIPLPYNTHDLALHKLLQQSYTHICHTMTHTYHDHYTLYPEFHLYRQLTEHHHFTVDI